MKKLFILLVFCSLSFSVIAQKDVDFESNPSFKDRIFFGGGLGFSGSSHQTNITLSPIV